MAFRSGKNFKKCEGYLLLELMLAMVFISVALVGLLNAYRTFIKTQNHLDFQTQTFLLLEKKINELEINQYYQVGLTEGIFPNHKNFKWKTEIREMEIPSLYRVNVTVSHLQNEEDIVVYLREEESSEL